MQPNPEEHSPKPRRRKRKSHSSLHEGEGEGWAVSYSDMLMVLMSFFIIFYNADDAQGKGDYDKPGVVDGLIAQFKAEGLNMEADPNGRDPASVTAEDKNGAGEKDNIGQGDQAGIGKDIEKEIKEDEINLEIDPNTGEPVKKEQVVKTFGEENQVKGFPKGEGEQKKGNALSRSINSFFFKNKRKENQGFGKETGLGLGKKLGDDIGKDNELDGITFKRIEPSLVKKDGKWNRILKQTNDENLYKGGVLIDFQDDLYENGKFDLSIRSMSQIKKVLDLIKPYKDKVNIVFIGHADSVPIKGKNVINSNMILSTLRAAKAVQFAIDRGFDYRWVSSQGLSEYARNTRSLSIRIMER